MACKSWRFDESTLEMTFKPLFPWREQAQGSSKKDLKTSVECLKDDNLEFASRHQVRDADFCEGNSSDARPYDENDECDLNG